MTPNRDKIEEKLIDRISKTVLAGNVGHAYILEGDSHVDKESFARYFVKAIICEKHDGKPCGQCLSCRKVDGGNFEDLYFIASDGMSVKDESISNLQESLKKKPVGERSFAVISDADTMTVRAQNRLLKTLEEPTPGTVIMLLSENAENLLETVRSRCIIYHLNGISRWEADKPTGAEALVSIIVEKGTFLSAKQVLAKYVKSREDAFLLLDGMERIYRNIFLGLDEKSRAMNKTQVFRAVELLEEARRDLIRKVNYNYALKNLIIKTGGTKYD